LTGKNKQGGPRFYGRRHGHKLRSGRQALIDDLLPRLRVALPVEGETLDLAAAFEGPVSDLWLEVGFGGGEHLAAQARAHPDIGFIGSEPFVNGVANVLSLIDSGGLTNVRIFDDDVRKLFPVLPDAAFGRIIALFTDPWPKKRHHRRRFINHDTVLQLARLLKDDGELRLASDHMGYVDWMLDHLTARDEMIWRARSKRDWAEAPSDWVETRYERKAKAKGVRPAYLCFSRLARRPR
jgi:tRNA (guanine-N7-)-methyltransferase